MKNLLLCSMLLALFALQAQSLKLVITQDKKNCRYKISEPVNFYLSAVDADGKNISGQKINYRFTGDGGLDKSGTVISADTPVKLTETINVCGFIRLNASLLGGKVKPVDSGAAFEPEKIVSSTPDPDDFDEFWAKELAAIKERLKSAKITVKPSVTPARWEKMWNTFDVRIEDGVINAGGMLIIPKEAKKKSYPIVMCFSGASKIGAYEKYIYKSYKCISFLMNLHDTENIIPRSDAPKYRKLPNIKDYQLRRADSLSEYGTGIIFRRVLMSKEFLKTLPEWDGRNIITRGSSMGGAQSIVAASGDPLVKLCIAGAPAMCNHFGSLNNQISGWPNLFKNPVYAKNQKLSDDAKKVMPYFDIVNFARRVKCPVIMSVGFIDYVCPPTSIFAAFNALGTTEKVLNEVPMGNHGANLDKTNKIPGVFGYGGNEVNRLVRKMNIETRKAAEKSGQ